MRIAIVFFILIIFFMPHLGYADYLIAQHSYFECRANFSLTLGSVLKLDGKDLKREMRLLYDSAASGDAADFSRAFKKFFSVSASYNNEMRSKLLKNKKYRNAYEKQYQKAKEDYVLCTHAVLPKKEVSSDDKNIKKLNRFLFCKLCYEKFV